MHYSILHPEKAILRIGEQSWAMREGIARMEYLVLRILKFDVEVDNSHQVCIHCSKTWKSGLSTLFFYLKNIVDSPLFLKRESALSKNEEYVYQKKCTVSVFGALLVFFERLVSSRIFEVWYPSLFFHSTAGRSCVSINGSFAQPTDSCNRLSFNSS